MTGGDSSGRGHWQLTQAREFHLPTVVRKALCAHTLIRHSAPVIKVVSHLGTARTHSMGHHQVHRLRDPRQVPGPTAGRVMFQDAYIWLLGAHGQVVLEAELCRCVKEVERERISGPIQVNPIKPRSTRNHWGRYQGIGARRCKGRSHKPGDAVAPTNSFSLHLPPPEFYPRETDFWSLISGLWVNPSRLFSNTKTVRCCSNS